MGWGPPSGGGGGAVASVFGRTGAVVANPADYATVYDALGAASGPLGGDLAGSPIANALLKQTINSWAVIRASTFQDVTGRGGTTGVVGVGPGTTTGTTQNGVIDILIGDSIARSGGTAGATDWATVLSSDENRANGYPDPFFAFLAPQHGDDATGWSTLTNGALAGAGSTQGLSALPTAWTLSAAGSISDLTVTVAAVTTTTGSNVATVVSGGFPGVIRGQLIQGIGIPPKTFVQNVGGNTLTMTQTATASAANTLTFGRPFRRCKIYYYKVTNGDAITFATTGNVVSSGALDTNGSGIGVWDSGDLGSAIITAGTGISATWGAHVSGAGGAGSTIIGVRYYWTDGTNGITVDNISYGGTNTTQWASNIGNVTAYINSLVALGTPPRRCYICLGINDPSGGVSQPTNVTNMATIITSIQASSPTTEVIVIGEHYGDTIKSIAACSFGSGSGSIVVSTVNAAAQNPNVGALIVGPGIGTGVVCTVTAVNPGVSFTMNVTGGSVVTQAGVTLSIAQNRGGATNWANSWIPGMESAALSNKATFINMYERFGDFSGFSQIPAVTLSTASLNATVASGGFPGVAIGQAVSGTGISLGTFVTNVSGNTVTLSVPPWQNGTVTLLFTNDAYGLGQASTPDIHFGDASQSISGRDGQRAFAQAFETKLSYATEASNYPVTGPSNTGATASTISTLAATNGGGGIQAHLTRDVMVYLQVGNAGTALAVSIGANSNATGCTIVTGATATAGESISFRLPAGWYYKWSATTATLSLQRAVLC